LIVAIENYSKGGNIGHALICIGRDKIADSMIDSLPICKDIDSDLIVSLPDKVKLFDFSEIECRFVFIDDNCPAYQKAFLDEPAVHYPNPSWHNCQITYFIAPLYPKIYLEAFEARKYFFIRNFCSDILPDSEILTRFFLTSSRTYKNKVAGMISMSEDLKSLILETSMPKFIWIGELTTKALLKEQAVNGIVILDATEANILHNKPLIMAAFVGKIVTFAGSKRILSKIDLDFNHFDIFIILRTA
jgi:hypothetical protein